MSDVILWPKREPESCHTERGVHKLNHPWGGALNDGIRLKENSGGYQKRRNPITLAAQSPNIEGLSLELSLEFSRGGVEPWGDI